MQKKPNSDYHGPLLCEAHWFFLTSPRFLNVKGQVKCIGCKVLPIQFDIRTFIVNIAPQGSLLLRAPGDKKMRTALGTNYNEFELLLLKRPSFNGKGP